jgi:hypothetical protein
MVGVSGIGKGLTDPPLFTDRTWVWHFWFYQQRHTKMIYEKKGAATQI